MGELFRSSTFAGSTDVAGKDQRTRIWRVEVPPTGVWRTIDPNLPQPGDPYPYPAGTTGTFPLRMDRYEIAPTEDGLGTYVTLVYTNDRSGRLRPVPDVTRPSHQSWSVDIQKTTQDIPTVMVFPQPVPGANVLEAETPDAEKKLYKVSHTYGVYEVTVPLTSMTTSVVDAIRAQTDHIHFIGRNYYRFEPGSIVLAEPNVWVATYRWIGDDGLEWISGLPFQTTGPGEPMYITVGDPADNRKWYFPPPVPNMLPPVPGGPNLPDMIRSPFHVLAYALKKNMVPEFSQFCPFAIDDLLGWQSLPGNLDL